VYQLAHQFGLTGWVLNDALGVTIHWEGEPEAVAAALEKLKKEPPPLAKITSIQVADAARFDYAGFYIQESHISEQKEVLISPDVATCSDCLTELQGQEDRRFSYPFINCTNCGPRFTLIKDRPYDRDKTSMSQFTMCPECLNEYEDPLNRRFHAQPNCCPQCGPQLKLVNGAGQPVENVSAIELLKEGYILAVKGLGGFHLACNAQNQEAVAALRKRKKRDYKPFALMAGNLAIVRRYCHFSIEEEEALVSPARPIVILRQKKALPETVNKGLDTLGVMLPYTPLHRQLFDDELPLLVMTSANLAGEPLVWDNQQALARLKGIADYFLLHNRDIENPCDDSIGAVISKQWQVMRRARGYVPLPVRVEERIAAPLLAVGGDLKSSFALAKVQQVFLSQHLGDLDNVLNQVQLEKANYRMQHLTGVIPKAVITDLHPNYHSVRWAKEFAKEKNIKVFQVQHHYAHLASCMADNGLVEPVLGVICDGTGYGLDGEIWGFEFLHGNFKQIERLGHLAYTPLPGGEVSIKRPERMAYSFIRQLLGQEGIKRAKTFLTGLSPQEQQLLEAQLEKKINAALTSSAGRLFDAVSSLVTGCTEVHYEGQGAMELEALARSTDNQLLAEEVTPYSINLQVDEAGKFTLDVSALWRELLNDLDEKRDQAGMALSFHLGLAEAVVLGVKQMARLTGLAKVVLSGGVFQNRVLAELVDKKLQQSGFVVYQHKQVPTNDGGIALGQIAIGNEEYKSCV
jgi:hydrogenase maturation protein HypF